MDRDSQRKHPVNASPVPEWSTTPRTKSALDQTAGAFAQLTYRESLRDIEACLRSLGAKLYHMEPRR